MKYIFFWHMSCKIILDKGLQFLEFKYKIFLKRNIYKSGTRLSKQLLHTLLQNLTPFNVSKHIYFIYYFSVNSLVKIYMELTNNYAFFKRPYLFGL